MEENLSKFEAILGNDRSNGKFKLDVNGTVSILKPEQHVKLLAVNIDTGLNFIYQKYAKEQADNQDDSEC